jgi:hypothetical protein
MELDKFYTIPSVVDKCLEIIGNNYNWNDWDLVVEPSAGNGSFFTKLPTDKRIGIDISPEHTDIIKQDYFTYRPPSKCKRILVIGNPPFGRISSLAIRFFNHSAEWCDVIAFIIPLTFRRISVQNKLNSNFHLVVDEEIPTKPCSFSPPMMAKCCFQIWERRDTPRHNIKLTTIHDDFKFLPFGEKDDKGQPTPPSNADFAIRAYGGKCGEIIQHNLHTLTAKNIHWIKSNINIDVLMTRFKSLDYSISHNTVRQNSIGKGELVKLYIENGF